MPVYCITGMHRGPPSVALAFVRQLAESADNTIIAATPPPPWDIGDIIAVASPTIHIIECDISNVESIQSFVEETARVLGGGERRIDFLVNSPGASLAPWQSSLNLGPAELQVEMAVNVIGPAKTVELLVAAGLLSSDVRILHMTSELASLQRSSEMKPRRCAVFSISKAALNMLTVHQSEDLKQYLPGAVVISTDPGPAEPRMDGDGAMIPAVPRESIDGMLRVLQGLKE